MTNTDGALRDLVVVGVLLSLSVSGASACEPQVVGTRSECYEIEAELTVWPAPESTVAIVRTMHKVVEAGQTYGPIMTIWLDGEEVPWFGSGSDRELRDLATYQQEDFQIRPVVVIVEDWGDHSLTIQLTYPRDELRNLQPRPECTCSVVFRFQAQPVSGASAKDVEWYSQFKREAEREREEQEGTKKGRVAQDGFQNLRFNRWLYQKVFDEAKRAFPDGESSIGPFLSDSKVGSSEFLPTAFKLAGEESLSFILARLNESGSACRGRSYLGDELAMFDCAALSCDRRLTDFGKVLAYSNYEAEDLGREVLGDAKRSCSSFPVSLMLLEAMEGVAEGRLKYEPVFGWFVAKADED